MRKTVVMAICIIIMGMASIASATKYDSGYVPIPGDWLNAGDKQSWSIPVAVDLQIPYDHLNSATLSITAISTTGRDEVYLNNIVATYGTSEQGTTWWYFDKNLFPNIKSIYSSDFPTGASLAVTVVAGGDGLDTLKLGTSKLIIDYNSAPVPEPGTLMLIGVGLGGLAVWGKRRRIGQ